MYVIRINPECIRLCVSTIVFGAALLMRARGEIEVSLDTWSIVVTPAEFVAFGYPGCSIIQPWQTGLGYVGDAWVVIININSRY